MSPPPESLQMIKELKSSYENSISNDDLTEVQIEIARAVIAQLNRAISILQRSSGASSMSIDDINNIYSSYF